MRGWAAAIDAVATLAGLVELLVFAALRAEADLGLHGLSFESMDSTAG